MLTLLVIIILQLSHIRSAFEYPGCSVEEYHYGVKPKARARELHPHIIKFFKTFEGGASACSAKCCQSLSCTTAWMLELTSVCVLLNCTEKQACYMIPSNARSSMVNVSRNKGENVEMCSVEGNSGCGEHQECKYTHFAHQETHCVCQHGYELNNITQTCVLSELSTSADTLSEVTATPEVDIHQSCNVQENTGCGANQKCQQLYFGSSDSHCICVEGYVLSGEDCVSTDDTHIPPTDSQTLETMPVQLRECVVSHEKFSLSQFGICGEHAYCKAIHPGENWGHCYCHNGYLLDSEGNCVDNLTVNDGHTQNATATSNAVGLQQKCNPWNVPPDNCGNNTFCYFTVNGGGHCLCKPGYTFNSQHSCVPKNDTYTSPTQSSSRLSMSHLKANTDIGEKPETLSQPVSSQQVLVTTTPLSRKTTNASDHAGQQHKATGLGRLEGDLNALEDHTDESTMVQTSVVVTSTPSFSPINKVTMKPSTTPRMELITTKPIKSRPPVKATMTTAAKVATTHIPTTEKPIISSSPMTTNPSQTGTSAFGGTIVVSAGDNKDLTLPQNSVTLIATTFPEAPPSDELYYLFEWQQIAGPTSGSMDDDEHSSDMTLSQLKEGLYCFRVTAKGKNGEFGTGFVNVTVHPPERINKPPHAVITTSNGRLEVTLPQSTVILDAKKSTDDADGLKFHWEQVKHPLKDSIDHAQDQQDDNSPILVASDLIVGKYQFKVTVTDSDGATDVAYANVTVHPEIDYPPHANAGDPVVIKLPIDSATLYGNGSKDDKGIIKYQWEKDPSSPQEGDMTGTTSKILQLRHLSEGLYTFTLTVTDIRGQTDKSKVDVVVQAANNIPPIVNAGPDVKLIWPANTVTLDGRKTSDDMGPKNLKYQWEMIKGPQSSHIMLDGVNSSVVEISDLEVGKYTFKLTVTDGQGAASSNTVNVDVQKDDNKPPVADAGPDVHIRWPTHYAELDGSKSFDDDKISYHWTVDHSSPATLDIEDNSDFQPVLKVFNLIPGKYKFHLTVEDTKHQTDSDAATVFVEKGDTDLDLVDMHVRERAKEFTYDDLETVQTSIAVALGLGSSCKCVIVERVTGEKDDVHVLFYVKNETGGFMKAPEIVDKLSNSLLDLKQSMGILEIRTYVCQETCSGHGTCDLDTDKCVCDHYWMENPFKANFGDKKTNCDWSIVYVVLVSILLVVIFLVSLIACICAVKHKRGKAKRRHRYALLNDTEEETALSMGMLKKGKNQKGSLMVSESDTDGDDILFDSSTKPLTSYGTTNGLIKNNRAKSLKRT